MPGLLQKLILSSALLVAIGEGAPCNAPGGHAHVANGKAVYFLSNNAENAVVALPIGPDGTLGNGTITPTGGKGSNVIDGSTNEPAAPDALDGQAPLTVAGNNLFAVNAGSNTVSMFTISPQNPLKLSMVGQPASLPGEFPVTVAASTKNKLACVGTTGAKAGVSCSPFSEKGLGQMDGLRPFDLNQTTPPVGPPGTVSETFWSNDESMLFTTVKGDPSKNTTGFLSVFPITQQSGSAALSMTGVESSPKGTAVLFGSKPIPGTNDIYITDASFGAGILSVQKDMTAILKDNTTIADQVATCWTTISPVTKTAFVTDVGINRLIEMSLSDASVVSIIDLRNQTSDPGFIDTVAAGKFVYALSPGNGTTGAAISVVDAVSKQLVQHFELGMQGSKNSAGMAFI